jgi:nitrate/nitrite transporter NarK
VGLACSVVFSDNLFLAVVSLALAAAGTMSALPLQWTFSGAFISGSGAGAAIALINSVGNLGGIVSSALIGWLKDRTSSFDTGMYVVAVCAALSAVIALSFPARLVNK